MTKTLTFAVMHFTIAFTVAYVITGSVLIGGAVALIEPAINTVAFYFHEKIWARYSGSNSQAMLVNIVESASESYALRSM
ncbi:hypothetical protein MSP8887_00806 [Marinomonas spartinae]|uniref:DUF2061 domain-containing protein n=1 Tax=Marinomonas spartinae TaxID=1792290 RepID=UPI0008090475|nr:DUF2061 domain-containing protein [Marinomonas spartinae]SBS28152.1 hypothetical protein MSP8887_00806 [Marinomonas spartinae]